MEFEKQITNLKISKITTPRVFLSWENTENGRDKYSCYERIDDGYVCCYVNVYNSSSTISSNDEFFKKLEKMYQSANTIS